MLWDVNKMNIFMMSLYFMHICAHAYLYIYIYTFRFMVFISVLYDTLLYLHDLDTYT